ncbi:MAG: NAD(P)-dependent alcohol dehydrogenase [Myxococcales bacterium]
MRAIVYDRFGGPEVLEERDIAAPEPASEEVLVRIRAAALNPKDIVVRAGKFRWMTGARFPMPFGHDFAGEVVALGHNARGLSVGDRVFGCWNDARPWRGSFAEYAVSSPDACAVLPPTLSFEEGASLGLAGQTALQALVDVARVSSRDHVLIHGASGGVGTLAVQLAKGLGAHVTTTSSSRNLALCRQLGADETLEYAVDSPFASPRRYDVIFDVFGNRSFGEVRPVLDRMYVTTVPSARIALDSVATLWGSQRARLVVVHPRRADLERLLRWVEDGALLPVVDRVFTWREVREAVRYLETKRARGKVVVRIP